MEVPAYREGLRGKALSACMGRFCMGRLIWTPPTPPHPVYPRPWQGLSSAKWSERHPDPSTPCLSPHMAGPVERQVERAQGGAPKAAVACGHTEAGVWAVSATHVWNL
eukprot:363319-Chlamydomonas_euryale.AAC.5